MCIMYYSCLTTHIYYILRLCQYNNIYYVNPESWRSIINELYWVVKDLLEEYMEVHEYSYFVLFITIFILIYDTKILYSDHTHTHTPLRTAPGQLRPPDTTHTLTHTLTHLHTHTLPLTLIHSHLRTCTRIDGARATTTAWTGRGARQGRA